MQRYMALCQLLDSILFIISPTRVQEVQRRPPPCIHASAAVAGAVSASHETRKSKVNGWVDIVNRREGLSDVSI